MKSFHNDPAIKAKYIARLAEHRRLEHLAQGVGFYCGPEGTKGCAVGCTLEAYDHSLYPTELGLPEWLARLEDRIFEGLPKGQAEQFAEDFLAAIPIGADVGKVRSQLAVLRLTRQLPWLDKNPEPYARQCAESLRQVIACHESGESTRSADSAAAAAESARSAASDSAAESARSAASDSAAESAAWAADSAAWAADSAAWESAARSADSAAESARSAARAAAESAAWAADSDAAWAARSESESKHFQWEAETLLRLLRESGEQA